MYIATDGILKKKHAQLANDPLFQKGEGATLPTELEQRPPESSSHDHYIFIGFELLDN